MKRSMRIAGIGLMALLALAGCDNDNDNNVLSLPASQAQTVSSVSQEVIGGAVQRTNLTDLFDAIASGFSAKSALGEGTCNQVDGCSNTGTLEICEDSSTFGLTFGDCLLDGEVIAGTIDGTGSDHSGSVTYNVAIDDLTLTGTISFVANGDCYAQGYSQFTSTSNGVTGVYGGDVTYCPGSDYPTGTLSWAVTGSLGAADMTLTFNGTASVAVVLAGSTGGSDANCTVDLSNFQATCT